MQVPYLRSQGLLQGGGEIKEGREWFNEKVIAVDNQGPRLVENLLEIICHITHSCHSQQES